MARNWEAEAIEAEAAEERASRRRGVRHARRGPHKVWLKVPLSEAEVYGRYPTRRAAERIAKALEKKYARHDYGRGEAWVESPGSIEEKLRKIYEEEE